jgi:NADH-quinone oxidoreductase subunit I
MKMKRVQGFLQKVFLLDILQGLLVTLKHYFSPKVTVPYPEKIKEPSGRFRGILRLYRDEKGEPLCIACQACQRACPTDCFTIEGARLEGSKVLRPTRYDWKLYRCSFCGLCTEVCPTDAIRFSREFRMSFLGKDHLLFRLPDMYLEGEALQEFICGGCRR